MKNSLLTVKYSLNFEILVLSLNWIPTKLKTINI